MKTVNHIFTIERLYKCCGNIDCYTLFEVYCSPSKKVFTGPYMEMKKGFCEAEIDSFYFRKDGTIIVNLID